MRARLQSVHLSPCLHPCLSILVGQYLSVSLLLFLWGSLPLVAGPGTEAPAKAEDAGWDQTHQRWKPEAESRAAGSGEAGRPDGDGVHQEEDGRDLPSDARDFWAGMDCLSQGGADVSPEWTQYKAATSSAWKFASLVQGPAFFFPFYLASLLVHYQRIACKGHPN